MSYVYDKNKQPYYITNNTRNVFNDNGERLEDILKELKKSIGERQIIFTNSLPEVGLSSVLYCNGKDFYYWESDTGSYKVIRPEILNDISALSHTHANKGILDMTTAAFTTELSSRLSEAYEHTKTEHAPSNAQKNVQSDWLSDDRNSDSYIQNKPQLGTASEHQVEDFATPVQGIKADSAIQNIYVGDRLIEKENAEAPEVHIPEISGGISTGVYENYGKNYIVTTNEEGKLVADKLSSDKLDHLANVESDIQVQFNNLLSNLQSEITRATDSERNITDTINVNRNNWNNKYTREEIDNKFSTYEYANDWKESVETYDDILTAYPNPEKGWTVNAGNTTYRYDGEKWVDIGITAIPKATSEVSGLLSKEDKLNYDDANAKKHEHLNKSTIDKITETLLSSWNEGYEKAHVHPNKEVLDSITEKTLNSWDNICKFGECKKVDDLLNIGHNCIFRYDGTEKNMPDTISAPWGGGFGIYLCEDNVFAVVLVIQMDTNNQETIYLNLFHVTMGWVGWKRCANSSDIDSLQEEISRLKQIHSIVLEQKEWSDAAPYSQSIDASWIAESDNPIIMLKTEDDDTKKAMNCITKVDTADGLLTITCDNNKPAVDIPLLVRL